MRIGSRLLVCGLIVWATSTGALAQVAMVNGVPAAAADESLKEAAAAADAARRLELAESILSLREAGAGRSLDARYRAFLKADLASSSVVALESVLAAGGEGNLRDPGLLTPGDTSADLVYTPVPPCRVFDTRVFPASILAAGTQRDFYVAGTMFFPDQGGTSGGCGIPLGPATSVMINFAAVTPTGPGNLRAWAVATPQPPAPFAAVMNFSTAMPALANGIAVPICDAAMTTCGTGDLRLQADVSSVHVVGDVVGYFSRLSSPRTTPIFYSGGTIGIPTTTPTFLKTLGNFTKAVADSAVHVTWHGHVHREAPVATNFCQIQVRVDGIPPTGVPDPDGFGAIFYGADAPATLTGRWTGLAAGVHTVSLWLRGLATSCTVNFGDWNSQQAYVVEQ